MAGGKLEVQIGADKTDFDKKIKEVEFDIKELSKVKLDRLKIGLDTSEINAQIKDAKANLNSLKTTVKDTGAQIGGQFTKQVGNGGNTLMQFSRIAQDAPFGIMGIGNNITATAESFSYLKQQTGSTGGALKALASSIMGTGGLLLGVSLLTTGFTLLAQSGLSIGDVIDKITGKFDGFGAAIKKASEEGVKSTIGEISSLKELLSVAQDENKSKKERFAAVQELQKLYPAYFGNLSAEKIMTSDLTGTVNELTKALINKAIAEKLTEAAIEPTLRLYKANAELLKLKEQEIVAEKQLSEAVARGDSARSLAFYSDNLKRVKTELNTTRAVIVQATNETNRLQDSINKIGGSASKLLIKEPKKGKTLKDTPQVSGIVNALIPAPQFDLAGIAVFNGQVDAFGNKIKELPGVIKTTIGTIPSIIDEGAILMAAALIEFNNSANELIVNTISGTFSQLGEAIGNAIATGGDVLSAIGTTLIQAFAGFLSNMGDLLIKYGTLAIIKGKLDLAILAGGPISIAAGIAAIAVGVALKAASGALGSFATGGGKGGSSGAGANNQSFSSSGFSSVGNGGGTVVFEIAGQKLIGVLNNTLNSNKRLGGTLGLG